MLSPVAYHLPNKLQIKSKKTGVWGMESMSLYKKTAMKERDNVKNHLAAAEVWKFHALMPQFFLLLFVIVICNLVV